MHPSYMYNNNCVKTSEFKLMAPPKFFFFAALTSSLLFIISASRSSVENHGINVPSALESEEVALTPRDDKKVNLTVYYESLNPDAALFLVRDLKGVFDNDLIKLVCIKFQ